MQEEMGSERLSSLPKATQLLNDKARLKGRTSLFSYRAAASSGCLCPLMLTSGTPKPPWEEGSVLHNADPQNVLVRRRNGVILCWLLQMKRLLPLFCTSREKIRSRKRKKI